MRGGDKVGLSASFREERCFLIRRLAREGGLFPALGHFFDDQDEATDGEDEEGEGREKALRS